MRVKDRIAVDGGQAGRALIANPIKYGVTAFILAFAIGLNFSPKTLAEWFLLLAVVTWLGVDAISKGTP